MPLSDGGILRVTELELFAKPKVLKFSSSAETRGFYSLLEPLAEKSEFTTV